jgi:hypothetical protein
MTGLLNAAKEVQEFTLKALNPVTMASYATLDLETDYAV